MSRTKPYGNGQQISATAKSFDAADSARNPPAADRQDILQLLLISWAQKAGDPITADGFLEVAGKELEPFFRVSPLGPIPEHLQAHHFVHQCVAEYEDRLEALDQWKARQLCNWLEQSVGAEVVFKGKTYRLQATESFPQDAARFWFEVIKPSAASMGT